MNKLSFRIFTLVVVFAFFAAHAFAQEVGRWDALTSSQTVNDITTDNDGRAWVITDGGMFSWMPGGSVERYTVIDGMHRLRPTSMTYDPDQNFIWLGYQDGTVQFYDIQRNRFSSLDDIRRNQNFTNRVINQIRFDEGLVYIATGFGIVVINPENSLVLDSYVNLGRYDRGTSVLDFAIEDGVIFAATPNGLAVGDPATGSLVVPTNWDNSDGQGSYGTFESEIRSLALFENRLYAATADGNREFVNGAWSSTTAFSGSVNAFRFSASGEKLTAFSNAAVTIRPGNGSSQVVQSNVGSNLTAVYLNDIGSEALFAGSEKDGLLFADPPSSGFENLIPSGPASNIFTEMKFVGNGTFISAASSAPGDRGTSLPFTGYYIYDNGNWQSFGRDNNDVLDEFFFESTFRTTFTENYYFFGSYGGGLAKHDRNTDDIQVFRGDNSPIPPFSGGSSSFTIVSGLDTDNSGNVWMTSLFSPVNPIIQYDPENEEWETFPFPTATGSGNTFLQLKVDSNNQKWLSTVTTAARAGRGITVWNSDTGESVRLNTNPNEGNLPDDLVNVIVQDRRGEVWIGTGRGVARFLFPDRVITGTAQDRAASFLINADTSATSPFLLRDINATAIAVNAANQKWIGSTDSGVWLIDENGRNVLRHFTNDNSPLFSNNIRGITIDDESGIVFIATDEGMVSYTDVVKEGRRSMDDLFVYPNPYSYDRNSGNVYIEGLSDDTTISIITVDGKMVNRLDARGGRAEWNVRDFNGNRVATGVYMVVANDTGGSERGVGKVVVVR